MHKRMTTILALAAALHLAVLPAAGQITAISLQKALDKPVDLTIEDAPIAEVFRRLSAKTGVEFIIDEHTMACLPYGDQTRVAVRLKNVTLRKDLSRMLAPQALQWSIKQAAVRIVPSEGLARMCRRASYDELRTLGMIYSQRLKPVDQGVVIDQLRKITGNKDLRLSFQLAGAAGADTKQAQAEADRALPGTAAQWLDRLCRGRSWTWYLWGDEIVILPWKSQVQRQLQQQVSLRYQNEKLMTVLLDLARKARLTLEMDPGVMNYIPSLKRTNFNLIMADASIAQALEVISGATGLKFLRTEAGLRVAPSEKLIEAGMQRDRRRTPFFLKISVPGHAGSSIEVFMRADELPDEVVQHVLAEKDKLIEKMRARAKGSATTRPAGAVE